MAVHGTARVGGRRRALALMAGAAAAACTCCRRASAQERFPMSAEGTCNYTALVRAPEVYTFASSADARAVVKRIVDQVGLPQNFVVRAATDVGNAAAVVLRENGEQRRYILYSEDFILRLAGGMHKDWPALSVLAHEVGHHYAGHTLSPGGSRPPIELEADRFSGFIVRRLGGSLDDAQAAMKQIGSERGSETHPGRSARLEAIAVGWRDAAGESQQRPDNDDRDRKPGEEQDERRRIPIESRLIGTWAFAEDMRHRSNSVLYYEKYITVARRHDNRLSFLSLVKFVHADRTWAEFRVHTRPSIAGRSEGGLTLELVADDVRQVDGTSVARRLPPLVDELLFFDGERLSGEHINQETGGRKAVVYRRMR